MRDAFIATPPAAEKWSNSALLSTIALQQAHVVAAATHRVPRLAGICAYPLTQGGGQPFVVGPTRFGPVVTKRYLLMPRLGQSVLTRQLTRLRCAGASAIEYLVTFAEPTPPARREFH